MYVYIYIYIYIYTFNKYMMISIYYAQKQSDKHYTSDMITK